MKKVYFFLIIIFSFQKINAQYDYVSTELGLPTLQGTARFVGSGGIMGSVGPDASVVTTNPAALGMYSRSELNYTPTFQVNHAGTDYIQFDIANESAARAQKEEIKLKFTIGNFMYVKANRINNNSPFKSSNIAFGITRTHDFNRKYTFAAQNPGASYAQGYAQILTQAYKINPSNFPISRSVNDDDYFNYGVREMLAGTTGLLYANPSDTTIRSYAANTVLQEGVKNIWGGVNELSISWAGSINDRFYVGAVLGLPIMNMGVETSFQESHLGNNNNLQPNSNNAYFVLHKFNEIQNFSGFGVNLKLGGLAKLNNNIRAAAFFHTPTYMRITDDTKIDYTSTFTSNSLAPQTFNYGEFAYSVLTPMRMGGGLSYVGKYGFVGAEYEFGTMSSSRFFFDNAVSNEQTLNEVMKKDRKNTHTIKIGAELALNKFRLRGGFNYRTSPYPTFAGTDGEPLIVENANLTAKTISFGAGYRGERTSVDIGVMNTQFEEYNSFYTYGGLYNYGIKNNFVRQHFLLTITHRFRR